jgi:amino acid adenylation domain-containing protein
VKGRKYRREVSDNDYVYAQLQELFSSFAINLVIEGKGPIDPAKLQEAVRKASEACPGARLVKFGNTWIDSGRTPPVHLIEEVEFDGKVFSAIPHIEAKMDPQNGPTSEVVILRANPAVLVFRVFHGVMDGKGVLSWIENIFRAMNGARLVPVEGAETDLMFLKRRPYRCQRHKLSFDVQTLERRSPTKEYRVWRQRLTLPGNPTCLVARIAQIICSLGVSDTNRFLVPVDIRRHQKGHLSTANLTLPILLEASKGEGWPVIHERLLTGLRNNDELNLKSADLGAIRLMPAFLLKLGVRAALAFQAMTNRQICGGVISNLGMIDLDTLSTEQFEATTLYSLTVQQPLAPFAIVISSNKHGVEIMISCYRNAALIARAKQILAALEKDLSCPSSYEQLNDTERDRPPEVTVIDLIQGQIARSPNAIAIKCGASTTSYGDLGRQMERMAACFSSLGVASGETVAIYLDRNVWLMPAILAVLKLGVTYVPIDPESVAARNSRILEDSMARICITTSNLKSRLSSSACQQFILVDEIDLEAQEISTMEGLSRPDGIAYQMYTSGSTGTPKGVQIEHRSLVNYLLWAKDEYEVDEQSAFPLFASIAFDSTLTSMFLPLIAGACIEVHEPAVNHLILRKIFASKTITHVKLSPSLLQLAVNSTPAPGRAKTLILGGEQLNLRLAQKTLETFGDTWRIVNEYGPTEATIGSITHTYNLQQDAVESVVPIGRPISNTKVHLLDENLNLCPPGKSGEIFLSGDCLARGYASNATETERRFVMLDGKTRAYKTGDRAQLNSRGDLVYLGRLDDQISIRGHRVEPGEIESVLCVFDGINEATLVVKEMSEDRSCLIAFYTSRHPIAEGDLREHMRASLPSHMQISQYVHLSKMPLTNNDKIDKAALPLPDDVHEKQAESPSVEQTSQDEIILAQIWRNALELSEQYPIHLNDDLYDLGGDSLTMLTVLEESTRQLLGGANEELFAETMTRVIAAPTFKNMSETISAIKQARDRPTVSGPS